MKTCKAAQDGKPCPNKVDEGQEYCPYHLASQVADQKNMLVNILATAGTLLAAAGIVPVAKTVLGKVVKFVASKKL